MWQSRGVVMEPLFDLFSLGALWTFSWIAVHKYCWWWWWSWWDNDRGNLGFSTFQCCGIYSNGSQTPYYFKLEKVLTWLSMAVFELLHLQRLWWVPYLAYNCIASLISWIIILMTEVNSMPTNFSVWLLISTAKLHAISYIFNLQAQILILPVDLLCCLSDAHASVSCSLSLLNFNSFIMTGLSFFAGGEIKDHTFGTWFELAFLCIHKENWKKYNILYYIWNYLLPCLGFKGDIHLQLWLNDLFLYTLVTWWLQDQVTRCMCKWLIRGQRKQKLRSQRRSYFLYLENICFSSFMLP